MSVGSSPSIACIGIIGQHDNPLNITLFPPHESEELEMHFLLNSSLDIFDIRLKSKPLDQDLGLLHAIDERLATYGWLTNTGIKFIIAIDMLGRPSTAPSNTEALSASNIIQNPPPVLGLRDADLKPAFKAIQSAYVSLLMNPFYIPEMRTPTQAFAVTGRNPEITSRKFRGEMERIGRAWYPGIVVV